MAVFRTGVAAMAMSLVASVAVQAAIPTDRAAISVSATVLARCNDTSCQEIPRTVQSGNLDQPSFDLAGGAERPVVTITY